jgi:hypothetical protein
MKFLAHTRFKSLCSALAIAGVLMLGLGGSALAASPTFSVGTYSGTTGQGQHFTLFVVDSACVGTTVPARPCLYASGPNNVELLVKTNCPSESSGSSYGVDLGPSVVPRNGVINQRQGLSPGTFTSHIVLTTHDTATGYFIAQANGCTSGKVTFTARRTGPIKY